MKNYWISKSKKRRFSRIQRIIESQWVGISTTTSNDKMNVFINLVKPVITGSVPSALKSRIKSSMGIGNLGDIIRRNNDDDLVYITLEGVEDWFIKYRIYDILRKDIQVFKWEKAKMPKFEDPTFVSFLESIVNEATENWKKTKDIKEK